MVVDDKDQTMILRQYNKVDDLGFSHAIPVDKEIKKTQWLLFSKTFYINKSFNIKNFAQSSQSTVLSLLILYFFNRLFDGLYTVNVQALD